jgi:hypothetical protein
MFGYSTRVSFMLELGLGVVALFSDDLEQLAMPVVTEMYAALLASEGYPAGAARA